MLREQELLQQALQSAAGAPVGRLTLGAVPSVMPIAASFAGLLRARHAGITVTLRSMSTPEIEAGLENLSLDLALGYGERVPTGTGALSTLLQYSEHYFLLRRAAPPRARGLRVSARACTWAEAAAHPLCLLTPEMHNRAIVDEAFRQAGVQVAPAIETNSVLALGLAVLAGDVHSILPGALVSTVAEYGALEAVPLRAPEVITQVGFIFRAGQRASHTLHAALELARDDAWLAHLKTHGGALQR